jgi:methylmalonyl-CoA/ethylmalonyl-CoA epimerase
MAGTLPARSALWLELAQTRLQRVLILPRVGILKIDHVGIAVADLNSAVQTYTRLLGRDPSHRQRLESDGIEAVMFELGDSRVELLGAVREASKISNFINKRGGGLHHVAYGVENVAESLQEFSGMGLQLLDHEPRPGAAGRLVAFLHPSAADGVLTELCQPSEASVPQNERE